MSTFVLLPGAWLGAWVWEPVVRELEAHGNTAHAITLPGLAAHDAGPVADIGLADHVAAVRGLLARLDVREAVLAGHSYAGLVAGQAAAAEPERVGHLVFVDANVPVDGESMIDRWSAEGRRITHETIDRSGGRWPAIGADGLAGQGLAAAQIATLAGRAVPHPGRTITEPVVLERPLAGLRGTYVNCTVPDASVHPTAAELRDSPSWHFADLATGHWPMLSQPVELAALLMAAAARDA